MQNSILEYLLNSYKEHPDRVALSDGKNICTYRQLVKQVVAVSNQINRHNFNNRPIGVIGNRNINTVAQFFGVLYSGNYYVPIDPDMPTEKIKMIVEDAGISVLLGENSNKIIIEKLFFEGSFYPFENIGKMPNSFTFNVPLINGNKPAYMIYTSGSTGVPKGVIKSHNSIISFIETYTNTFNFSDDEIIGNQTPFFFDASAKDIYLMIKLGCTMEILPTTLFSMPTELIDYLNKKHVTYACWVPTAISIVAQLNPFSYIVPTTLRKLYFVGEVLQIKHLSVWMNNLPNIEYVNLYGSTETAGVSCYYKVTPTDLDKEKLPIGKPFKNCKVYIINEGKVVETPNCIGELFVVSDTLAIEYFNDKDKTEKSFLNIDFGEGAQRCLKTGDLASYDENGNIVFASRKDYQIKHMGRRIELGEIESVCSKLEEINRCCCIYDSKKKRIILVCSLSQNYELQPQEIKRKLKERLSSYMIPGKIIVLNSIPINANGKIDRKKINELYLEQGER